MDSNELAELKQFIVELKADRAATKEKEKRDAWTKYVSLSVVIIAVLGSFAAQMSGKFAGRAQQSQAQASDTWNLYQARSIKGHLLEVVSKQMGRTVNTNDAEAASFLKSFDNDIAKYNQGKVDSDKLARAWEKTRDESQVLGGKIGSATQLIYVAIALSSMCLLTKKKPLWLLAMVLAAVGAGLLFSAHLQEKSGFAAVPTTVSAAPAKPGA